MAVLPWPEFPYLNPIEHLWDEMERRLRARLQQPKNLHRLAQALKDESRAKHQEGARKYILFELIYNIFILFKILIKMPFKD